jgi:hypothetical protein
MTIFHAFIGVFSGAAAGWCQRGASFFTTIENPLKLE